MTWNNVFQEELKSKGSFLAYFTSCLVQNWYFVCKIQKYLSNNRPLRILEAGAGTGFLAIYLSSLGHKVFAMDTDTRFIEKASLFFKSNISIMQHDIRMLATSPLLPRFDLIYNIGVMEHFEDGDIIKIFKNFKSSSDKLIFAIPNFKISTSYGDERYLSRRYWKRLLLAAGWKTKEMFGYNRYGLRKYLSGFVCKHTS